MIEGGRESSSRGSGKEQGLREIVLATGWCESWEARYAWEEETNTETRRIAMI